MPIPRPPDPRFTPNPQGIIHPGEPGYVNPGESFGLDLPRLLAILLRARRAQQNPSTGQPGLTPPEGNPFADDPSLGSIPAQVAPPVAQAQGPSLAPPNAIGQGRNIRPAIFGRNRQMGVYRDARGNLNYKATRGPRFNRGPMGS